MSIIEGLVSFFIILLGVIAVLYIVRQAPKDEKEMSDEDWQDHQW